MQACIDWVLIIIGTQVIKKKQSVQPVFPDYLSVSYDYGFTVNIANYLRTLLLQNASGGCFCKMMKFHKDIC